MRRREWSTAGRKQGVMQIDGRRSPVTKYAPRGSSDAGCVVLTTVNEPANKRIENLRVASIRWSDWPVPEVDSVAAGAVEARPRIRSADVIVVIPASHPIVPARMTSVHSHRPPVVDCGPRKAVKFGHGSEFSSEPPVCVLKVAVLWVGAQGVVARLFQALPDIKRCPGRARC
jgi:hypothetical protein